MLDWEKEYKDLLDIVESTESKLISTQLHIRALSEYFYCKKSPFFDEVGNWFRMASSIKNVNFIGVRDDNAYVLYNSEYENEEEKQRLQHNLINGLTRFLYVYSGFESLVYKLSIPRCPRYKGKINAVNYFIKERSLPSLPFYKETISNLRECLERSSFNRFINYFKEDPCTDINGVGLKIVYKLRNKLAQIDYTFPESGDWSNELPVEPEITKLLLRILLMTIQMILLANNKDSHDKLELFESKVIEYNDETEWKIDESIFLWGIHIPIKDRNKIQMEIKFN
jgi:hypothetical protein